MKRYGVLIVTFLILLAGCNKHYYSVNKDFVSLYLKKPESQRVYFFSSLDGYTPHQARQVAPKTWRVKVPADTAFTYFYNVDGDIYVPSCRYKENDDFGKQNCIYIPGM